MPIRGFELRTVGCSKGHNESTAADAAARPQDAQALSDVVRMQRAPLVRFLAQRTGSRDDANDIVQEACVRVLAVKRPESITTLSLYLWRSALNILTDHARHQTVHRRYLALADGADRRSEPSAEVEADAETQLSVLRDAVNELPPRCLQAFILRVLNGLCFADVGREMKISTRMAKIYVARSLAYLQQRLDAANRDEPVD